MPPKCRFTREEIIQAALDLTAEKGVGALTARSIVGHSCSRLPSPFLACSPIWKKCSRRW